jgi:hypothetical protein
LAATEEHVHQEDQMTDQSPSAQCYEKKKTTAKNRNFWRLSWLAETVDGWRDEKLKLVKHDTDGLLIRRENEPLGPNEQEVCQIETPSCRPDRVKVETVTLITQKGIRHQIDVQPEGWDTVFWTESSIEKFLFPYYHAHRLWDQDLEDLEDAFAAYPEAFAIRHRAPSTSAIMYEIQVGAFFNDHFEWYPVHKFIALVRQYLAEREAGEPGREGRARDTREPGAAPSRNP